MRWHILRHAYGVARRILLLAVALGVVAAGYAYYRSMYITAGPSPITAAVVRGSVVETVDATGTVEAVTTVQVGTQVSGTIQSLYADFNSVVRRGQVVAKLDPSLFQTQVDQAQATLAKLEADLERNRVEQADAERKLRRAQDLSGHALIPRSELEAAEAEVLRAQAALRSAEAQVRQAHASLNQAQVNLAHTVITAPIDGIVISRNVDVGQTVAASMQAPTLFVIARDLAAMQVRASISEADIGRIQRGQAVTFRVDAYPDETFAGSVTQIRLQPAVEQNVVSYTTVIDVPNPDLKLRPGMTASVTVEIARSDDVLIVPNAALRFQPTDELFAALGQTAPAPRERRDASMPEAGVTRPAARPDRPAAHAADDGEGPSRYARVWVLEEGRLEPAVARLGITNGTATAVLGGDLAEGAEVVTGTTAASPAATRTTSPLLPFGGRPPGGRQTAPATRSPGARP